MSRNIYIENIKKAVESGAEPLNITGISGSARAYLLSTLLVETERPCIIIVPGAKDAGRLYRELEFFFPETYNPNLLPVSINANLISLIISSSSETACFPALVYGT